MLVAMVTRWGRRGWGGKDHEKKENKKSSGKNHIVEWGASVAYALAYLVFACRPSL